MKQASQLNAIRDSLDQAIAREDWAKAAIELRKIVVTLVNATIENDEERVSFVNHLFDEVYDDLYCLGDLPSELDGTSLLWKTDSYREVAQIAREARPTLSPDARERRLKDARSRILSLLQDGNSPPRSNLEIAEMTGLHVATVARTLVALRAEQFVRSWPEGARMMNCLADPAYGRANLASRTVKPPEKLLSQEWPKDRRNEKSGAIFENQPVEAANRSAQTLPDVQIALPEVVNASPDLFVKVRQPECVV